MPAVHCCRMHFARVWCESCPLWDWASATLYTLAESSQFWSATRGDSQARRETLWLVHHRLLKKWDLNEVRHKHRGYTRGSKARRVFPSTFSLSPCLGFPRRECTAGISVWVARKVSTLASINVSANESTTQVLPKSYLLLKMECVKLWIMLSTTKYEFVFHSLESQTFNLQKKKKKEGNDGQDHEIIAVEDWTLGKGKNVEKISYLKKKKILKKFIKEKSLKKIVYLEKKKYLRKFWTWKPENAITILGKFCTWKKLLKSEVGQKKFWKKVVPRIKHFGTIKICHFWSNALEWESRFTLGLDAAKGIDYIEKCFEQNLSKIKFPTKNSATPMSISP